jgi:hypothetical protein
MKNTIKILAIFVVMMGFAVNSYGQSSASASTTAILITPLSITKTHDLDFSTLSSSATAGTAVIDASTGNLSVTGGVTQTGATTEQVATFTITGEPSDVITVANDVTTITLENGSSDQLTVNTFRYSMDGGTEQNFNGTATIASGGTSTLTVGATLNIPANTPAGTYNSTSDFTITINYQ